MGRKEQVEIVTDRFHGDPNPCWSLGMDFGEVPEAPGWYDLPLPRTNNR